MNILFMCVANSARSQLTEGLAHHIFGAKARVESAGSQPTHINPFVIEVLAEKNIDGSQQYSKSLTQLPAEFVAQVDYVVTLCAIRGRF